jgi:hypothetical protein
MPSSGMCRHVDLVRTDVPPKHRFTQDLHGATSQKTAFFFFAITLHILVRILYKNMLVIIVNILDL